MVLGFAHFSVQKKHKILLSVTKRFFLSERDFSEIKPCFVSLHFSSSLSSSQHPALCGASQSVQQSKVESLTKQNIVQHCDVMESTAQSKKICSGSFII